MQNVNDAGAGDWEDERSAAGTVNVTGCSGGVCINRLTGARAERSSAQTRQFLSGFVLKLMFVHELLIPQQITQL